MTEPAAVMRIASLERQLCLQWRVFAAAPGHDRHTGHELAVFRVRGGGDSASITAPDSCALHLDLMKSSSQSQSG